MDLKRHLQVLWRFRLILVAGVLLGTILALLASFRLDGTQLTWRSSQTFESTSTLFVTQPGFPWGRVTLPAVTQSQVPAAEGQQADGSNSSGQPTQRREYGVPERFADLAVLYAYLASSEQVRALMNPQPRSADEVTITPLSNPGTGAGLPLLLITAKGTDPVRVKGLTEAAVKAVKDYLKTQQQKADIASGARTEIQVLNRPSKPYVVEGHAYIGSVIAFFLMIAFAVGLAYVLENLRPRGPKLVPAPADAAEAPPVAAAAVAGVRAPAVPPPPPSRSSWDGPSRVA
jgi:hypothetical protein